MRILFAISILALFALLWVSVATARYIRRRRRRRRRTLDATNRNIGGRSETARLDRLDLSDRIAVPEPEIVFHDPSAKTTHKSAASSVAEPSAATQRLQQQAPPPEPHPLTEWITAQLAESEPALPPPDHEAVPVVLDAVLLLEPQALEHQALEYQALEPAVEPETVVAPEEQRVPTHIAGPEHPMTSEPEPVAELEPLTPETVVAVEALPAPVQEAAASAASEPTPAEPEAAHPAEVADEPAESELVLAAIKHPHAESGILEPAATVSAELNSSPAQEVSESPLPTPPPPRRPFRAVPPKHPLASLIPPIHRPDWAYFNKDMGDLSDPMPRAPRLRPTNQE